MAKSYIAGETKIRPGIYQRYTNIGGAVGAGARDGVNAIVTNASWGPVGVATVHETAKSIRDTYGNDDLIKAALAIKTGGAQKVYIYRPEGSGGAKGVATLGAAKVEAKYPGARALKVKVQAKPGSTTTKQFLVIEGTTVLESFDFAVNETDETASLIAATAKSNYVVVEAPSTGVVNAAEVELSGGKNATLTAENYADAFYALEPFVFNVLSTDTADTAVATLMGEYVKEAYDGGKFIVGVAGAPTTVDFATRCSTAKAFNNKQMKSTTGELTWNWQEKGAGYFMVDTRNTKVFSGFIKGRSFTYRGMKLTPGKTRLDWCTLSLTLANAYDNSRPGNILRRGSYLLAATGLVQNTDMKIVEISKNPSKLSISAEDGGRLGTGPVLCEGIPAKLSFAGLQGRVKCYALDPDGNRMQEVPVTSTASGEAVLEIGPQYKTVWYELIVD